jgi:hypothetical protein
MSQAQPVAGFAVSNVRHRAGIKYIYISLIRRRYQPVPGFSHLPRQKLYLCLVQFTAQAIQSHPGRFLSSIHYLPYKTW